MTEKANKPETSKAYAAFMAYCGLGPGRSLAKLAESLDKPASYIRQLAVWSSDFDWVKRAKEFDKQQLDKKSQEDYERKLKEEAERQAALKEMRERQAKSSQELQTVIIQHIKDMVDAGNFNAQAAAAVLKTVYENEQKVLDGIERVELTGKDGGPVIIKTMWGTPKIERGKGDE